jgi:hypothetical protein
MTDNATPAPPGDIDPATSPRYDDALLVRVYSYVWLTTGAGVGRWEWLPDAIRTGGFCAARPAEQLGLRAIERPPRTWQGTTKELPLGREW